MSSSKDHDRTPSQSTLIGTLRDALAAAAAPQKPPVAAGPPALPTPLPTPVQPAVMVEAKPQLPVSIQAPVVREASPTAAEAARAARGEAVVAEAEGPQTRAVRSPGLRTAAPREGSARTQLIRGRISVKRTDFHQDPVVGWLVVVGGQGLGAFRPIYEGNNTMGRGKSQRIAIDFGDETISNEEQAYIRYDSVDRKFLLVPNLAKTNIVAVNDRKPTGAVELSAMDLITMGRTQLVFVPFCGQDFDWAELSEMKG